MDAELTRIDGLLATSGVEQLFIHLSVEQLRAEAKKGGYGLSDKIIANHQAQSRLALRCEILRALVSGQAYRPMSLRLAMSPRERQFCGIDGLDSVRIPSKSRL